MVVELENVFSNIVTHRETKTTTNKTEYTNCKYICTLLEDKYYYTHIHTHTMQADTVTETTYI